MNARHDPRPRGITRRGFLKEGVTATAGGLLIPGLLLSACESPQRAQSTAELPVKVPREKVFVLDQIFRYSVARNFNVFQATTPNPTRQGLVFDTLWYIDQQTAQWINGLATDKPSYSSDFLQMTVKLRSGIAWSDGVEFTADDVVYTVKTLIANPGLVFSAQLGLYVDSVSAPDKQTVVFKLKQPNSRFHLYFTSAYNGVYMMARHVWEKAGDVKTFTHFPPVSLGAYKYADSDPNGYWELFQRRDDWQKTSAGVLAGQPGPEYVLTIFYGDDQHKIIAMTRHGLDVLMDLNFEAFASLRKSTSSARSWYKDFPWAYPNELNARFFGLNFGKPPLDNKDVRWALALALDIVGLQTAYVGGVTRVTPFLVPAVPSLMKLYHLPLEPWLKELTIDIGNGETFKPYDAGVPARIGQWAKKNGHSVGDDPDEIRKLFGIGWWKHSPETATRLLTKAGLRKSEGRWMLPNGQPWKISIVAAPDESDAFRLANGAQDQWKKFGIDVDVVALERSPFTTRQQTGDFDVASTWGAIAPYPIPDLWQGLNAWTSRFYAPIGQSTAASGSNNFVRFRSPEFDEAVAALGKLPPDDGQVIEMGQRAMKIWAENMLTLNTMSFKKFITTDDTYWTGWPSSEHPDRQPLYWFMGGRFTVQQISPTRSKK